MTVDRERLFDAAMSLSIEERAHLAALLMDSLDRGETSVIEDAWITEARRRLTEIQAGRAETFRTEDVEREAEEIIARADRRKAATG